MAKKPNLKPLGDRVLVQELEEESEQGGIVLPEDVEAEREFLKAEVLAIGTDEEIQVKRGDRVLIDGRLGRTLEIDGEEYRIVKTEDILALVE